MDDLARRLAHGLVTRLDEIELESGMENWQRITDSELREEALALHERIRAIKRSLRQI